MAGFLLSGGRAIGAKTLSAGAGGTERCIAAGCCGDGAKVFGGGINVGGFVFEWLANVVGVDVFGAADRVIDVLEFDAGVIDWRERENQC